MNWASTITTEKKVLLVSERGYNISLCSFFYTSLKMKSARKKTKKTELHHSTERKQEHFHIRSHTLYSKCHSIAAVLPLTPYTWGHFKSITAERQHKSISTGTQNTACNETFPEILFTLCTPVLTMTFQNCIKTWQNHINIVKLSTVLP